MLVDGWHQNHDHAKADGEDAEGELERRSLETRVLRDGGDVVGLSLELDERAVREGRVVPGMRAEDVRSVIGGPTSRTRIATIGQVSELWVYGERGTSRLTVRLLRRSPRAELTVVGVSKVAPR